MKTQTAELGAISRSTMSVAALMALASPAPAPAAAQGIHYVKEFTTQILIGGLLVLFAPPCKGADSDWLTMNFASYHTERRGQNEWNPGIGVEHAVDRNWRLAGGLYHNSHADASLYGVVTHTPFRQGRVGVGYMAGLATGYKKEPCPLVAALVAYEGREMGLNVGLIPADSGTLFFQLKMRLR